MKENESNPFIFLDGKIHYYNGLDKEFMHYAIFRQFENYIDEIKYKLYERNKLIERDLNER